MSATTISENPEFMQVVRGFKRNLPMSTVVFLIAVYLVTGYVGGSLNYELIKGRLISDLLISFAVSYAIAVGRMILVYYPLLNTSTPRFNNVGEITGFFLGGIAIVEIWIGVFTTNLPTAWAVGLNLLVIIGVVAELYLLKAIKKQIILELMSSPEHMEKLAKVHLVEKKYQAFVTELESGKIPDSIPSLFESTPKENPEVKALQNQIAEMSRAFTDFQQFALSQRQAPTKAQLKKGLEDFGAGNVQTPPGSFSLSGFPDTLELQPLEEEKS
jgi:hypothetical protein